MPTPSSTGKVMRVPEPTTVLIAPAHTPATRTSSPSQKLTSNRPGQARPHPVSAADGSARVVALGSVLGRVPVDQVCLSWSRWTALAASRGRANVIGRALQVYRYWPVLPTVS